MDLTDIWNKEVNVDNLPDEVHMELTVKKLANEMIRLSTYLDCYIDSNDLKEIKHGINHAKLKMVKLVAEMVTLFDWIDVSDIIYQKQLRALMEEYLLRAAQNNELPDCDICKRIKEEDLDLMSLSGKLYNQMLEEVEIDDDHRDNRP